jgi:hypothetical protein
MDRRQRTGASARDDVIAALGELIDALDRRVPRVERVGEMGIAREAAALKKEAMARIEELKRGGADGQTREAALADAVMTDDGGPPRKEEGRSTNGAAGSRTRANRTDKPHGL